MSRSFSGITPAAFAGTIIGLPAQAKNSNFGKQKASLPPTMVGVPVVWANYGASAANPNIAVSVTGLESSGARQALDKLLSVRIDNLGNSTPVYVFFSDTGYTVPCPANTVVWDTVQTAQFSAEIISEGLTNASGATTVYFCNFFVPPFSDSEIAQSVELWLASAAITRGSSIYEQNFGVPALGDQFESISGNVPLSGQLLFPVFSAPGGFIYITEMAAYASGIAGPYTGNLIFESTGAAGVFVSIPYMFTGPSQQTEQFRARGNFKLDGTQNWRWRFQFASGAPATGAFFAHLAYTTNPN